jgi:hypothetical protein
MESLVVRGVLAARAFRCGRTRARASYTPRTVNPGRAPSSSATDLTADLDEDRATSAPSPSRGSTQRRLIFRSGWRPKPVVGIAFLLLVLSVPFVVALVVLRSPHWYPVLDLAWTEMRLRDVFSGHPPLIGLTGRIGPLGSQGSHPGPLSFYSLWPFYQLFGAASWAMEAAAVSLNVLAMGAALWIAHRRGGLRLVLAVAAVLAVLTRAFGTPILTQPWNPYMPVLWFFVFILAVWSVACDDLPVLPVVAFAGSFCAQTHVPYLGTCVALGVGVVAYASVRAYRRRRNRAELRRFARWALISAGIAVLAWIPPVVDQLTTSPGNLSVLYDYFRNPPESPLGLRDGVDVLLVHLNPWRLVTKELANRQLFTGQSQAAGGSTLPGLALLVTWVGSAFAAWRLRHRALLRLDIVLAAALVLAMFSISRIFGFVWFYLVLWAWGLTALLVLAIVWTAAALVARYAHPTRRWVAAGGVALFGITAVFATLFTFDASSAEIPAPRLSRTLSAIVPPTTKALERGSVPGTGPDGHYLVTWFDPVNIHAPGFGFMNELERSGYDVKALKPFGPAVTPHRTIDPAQATSVVHLSIGGEDIRKWRAKPGVEEVAYHDPRSRAERVEYDRLRSEAISELEAAGLPDLVPSVDGNVFGASLSERFPTGVRDRLGRMADLGLPAAVFVGPVSAES